MQGTGHARFIKPFGLVLESGLADVHENISKEGKDFPSKCFMRPYYDRWTADMLLNHPLSGEKLCLLTEAES